MTIWNQLPRTSVFDISMHYNCSKVAINFFKKPQFLLPENLTNEVVFNCKRWKDKHLAYAVYWFTDLSIHLPLN